ncbi:PTS glucitol/sorbitol transporter subunit IIB [Pandoraea sputorum]|uniref:PTS glucitol/sorbitol transporter subunit IIB n=1 Tax=Pandoraea sputorum TaxID=93222 RepID=UPI00125B9F33|nr:PTS glucitol/sorbitol transporter subunit IIC [Pandoraea sputorum]VVE55709.1 PTS sorbitol transporter subunit IIB [Pandoraea sputorum]
MDSLNFLTHAAEVFIGIFNAGGRTFVAFVSGILPTLIVLLTAVYTLIALVGEPRTHGLARLLSKNIITRYSLLPLLAMFFLTNPTAYTFGVFVEERQKPAFYDAAVSLCHPLTGLFPHCNPGELFVWLGVAAGVTKLAEKHALPFSLPKLALYYLGVGLLVNLLRGVLTEAITRTMILREALGRRPGRGTPAGSPQTHGQARAYQSVEVRRGANGWGGPLVITPSAERNKIVAVTGGDIPKVAQRMAELTGATLVDGFRNPPHESEVAAVVIDCGGTARCGVYPRKRIPTINLSPVGRSGPLAQFITPDIYVSDVALDCVQGVEDASAPAYAGPARSCASAHGATAAAAPLRPSASARGGGVARMITTVADGMGGGVNLLYSCGRKSIDTVITNVLPFMAFVAMLTGVINATGLSTPLAHLLSPLVDNIVGLTTLSAFFALPFLSPVLGPGAVIAQVIGAAIVGPAIGDGTLAAHLALPALFACNTQVGCDFAPVGMALGEARPETIRIGVPALLISRQITGPVSVLLAWAVSFALK